MTPKTVKELEQLKKDLIKTKSNKEALADLQRTIEFARKIVDFFEQPSPELEEWCFKNQPGNGNMSKKEFREYIRVQKQLLEDAPALFKRLEEEQNKTIHYHLLPQVNHINKIAHSMAKKVIPSNLDNININDFKISGSGTDITFEGNGIIIEDGIKICIENYSRINYNASANTTKLLDKIMISCHERNSPLARFHLKEYMDLRGVSDEKTAREQVKRDLEALNKITIKFRGTGRQRNSWLDIRLNGGRSGIYRGYIEFDLSRDTYSTIKREQFMYIPDEYFKINESNHPHAAFFCRKIFLHYRTNLGRENQDIISVKTLIESSPKFPNYEETYSHFNQKIYEPFEKNMDILNESIDWYFLKKNSNTEVGDIPTNYEDFLKARIKIIMKKPYPDVKKLIKKRKYYLTKKKNSYKKYKEKKQNELKQLENKIRG